MLPSAVNQRRTRLIESSTKHPPARDSLARSTVPSHLSTLPPFLYWRDACCDRSSTFWSTMLFPTVPRSCDCSPGYPFLSFFLPQKAVYGWGIEFSASTIVSSTPSENDAIGVPLGLLLWNVFENRKRTFFSGRKTKRTEFDRQSYHGRKFPDKLIGKRAPPRDYSSTSTYVGYTTAEVQFTRNTGYWIAAPRRNFEADSAAP